MTEGPAHRRRLSASAWAVVEAMFEALLADRDASGKLVGPGPGELARLAAEMDDWMLRGGAIVPRGVSLALWLFDWLPVVFLGQLSSMRALPLPQRVAYLERLERTRFGLLATAFAGVKVPMVMLGYESGPLLADSGFDRASLSARRLLGTGAGA